MKTSFLLTFASLVLSCIVFAANAPPNPTLSENLQLTSFSVSPPSIYQGDLVEFSLGVKSVGNTVSDFDASVIISDTSGAQVSSIKFIHAEIAGGETQALSKIWDTSGLQPGNYSAIANVTDQIGVSEVLLARLEVLPVLPAQDSLNQNQPGQGSAIAGGDADCSGSAICGAPGNCVDNYTTQLCSFAGCPEKDYFVVQRCGAAAPPLLLRAERKICNSASFLCTENLQEDWLTSFCLSGLLAALLLFAALLWRTRHYGL
ncbi:MAG: hypothetical protein NTV88_04795 [Candidatus Micrarchaeota archaeon]|nr:hypothetical protein [Candidatus Micrarchaeota archaeon]